MYQFLREEIKCKVRAKLNDALSRLPVTPDFSLPGRRAQSEEATPLVVATVMSVCVSMYFYIREAGIGDSTFVMVNFELEPAVVAGTRSVTSTAQGLRLKVHHIVIVGR